MKSLPLYKYFKNKYGQELLVDVIDINAMKPNIKLTPTYISNFYSIILFTSGNEKISVNGYSTTAVKGVAACSRPGEVWKWNGNTKLEGIHLLFEEEFLFSFFNDPLFLNQFSYLQSFRKSPFLKLDNDLYERILHLYDQMRKEINNSRKEKDQHILRAMLYETLMLYNRVPQNIAEQEPENKLTLTRYVANFQQLVEANHTEKHDVEFYAKQLCITSNYLNKIIRHALGVSTKQYILSSIMMEAKRLLDYTSLSVEEISDKLDFTSATYFIRIFHNMEGATPSQYRRGTAPKSYRNSK